MKRADKDIQRVPDGTHTWSEFLSGVSYSFYGRVFYQLSLVKFILDHYRLGARLLEVGCGTGKTAMILADLGYVVHAGDIDEKLVAAAKELGAGFSNCHFARENIFRLPHKTQSFDLAYSQGVLEHFSDSEIVRAVAEQARVSEHVLVDVPNHRAKVSFGDERRMPISRWLALLSEGGLWKTTWEGRDRLTHGFDIVFPNCPLRWRRTLLLPVWLLASRTALFWGQSRFLNG